MKDTVKAGIVGVTGLTILAGGMSVMGIGTQIRLEGFLKIESEKLSQWISDRVNLLIWDKTIVVDVRLNCNTDLEKASWLSCHQISSIVLENVDKQILESKNKVIKSAIDLNPDMQELRAKKKEQEDKGNLLWGIWAVMMFLSTFPISHSIVSILNLREARRTIHRYISWFSPEAQKLIRELPLYHESLNDIDKSDQLLAFLDKHKKTIELQVAIPEKYRCWGFILLSEDNQFNYKASNPFAISQA